MMFWLAVIAGFSGFGMAARVFGIYVLLRILWPVVVLLLFTVAGFLLG